MAVLPHLGMTVLLAVSTKCLTHWLFTHLPASCPSETALSFQSSVKNSAEASHVLVSRFVRAHVSTLLLKKTKNKNSVMCQELQFLQRPLESGSKSSQPHRWAF